MVRVRWWLELGDGSEYACYIVVVVVMNASDNSQI